MFRYLHIGSFCGCACTLFLELFQSFLNLNQSVQQKQSRDNSLLYYWISKSKTNFEFVLSPLSMWMLNFYHVISYQICRSSTIGTKVLCFLTGFAGQLCLLALVRSKTFHSQAGTSLFKMSAAGAKSRKIHVAEWGRIASRVAHKFQSVQTQKV